MTGQHRRPAFLTPRRRRRLYIITGAALAVAGVYGVVDGNQSAGWLGLAAAVLGVAQDNVEV